MNTENNGNPIKKNKNPITWVPTVYFAMGFPYIVLSLVSVIMFKDLGINKIDIAKYTSLLIIPWSLKPLFSPIMEVFGSKKKYLIIAEIISALMFGAVVVSLPMPNFFMIVIGLMFVIALSGSVHDIAGDGVYMEQLDTDTQSKYSGWQGAFYNMAKVLANGGLVFMAGWLTSKMDFSASQAWQIIMAISGAIMLCIALYHLFFLPKDIKKENEENLKKKLQELWQVFKGFFTKRYIFFYIFFIILYRFAEGLTMKIVPLFLKDGVTVGGLGLSNERYGLVYGTFGTVAFIVGSIAAGHYVSKWGLKKTLFTLALCFNIPFAIYLLFAIFQPHNIWLIASGIVFEYFGYGFGFVGLILFMMQQIAPGKHQMAHYAFANSIMNLGVLIPGYFSGYLSTQSSQMEILKSINLTSLLPYLNGLWGYKLFFILVMIMTIPALIITKIVPFTYNDEKKKKEE